MLSKMPSLAAMYFYSTIHGVSRIIYLKSEGKFKKKRWFNRFRYLHYARIHFLVDHVDAVHINRDIWDSIPIRQIKTQPHCGHSNSIQLATQTLQYDHGLFDKIFDDGEDRFSIHRFQWLHYLLQNNTSLISI